MPILVDTNVILDIAFNDPNWADWADKQINRHQPDGLFINPVIYAELCAGAHNTDEVDEILTPLKIAVIEFQKASLFLAAKAFVQYRQRGGNRTSPLADFFIGAQADVLQTPILTRDTSRYQTYFPKVQLITPERQSE